jgi:hypothetical protein
MNKYEFWIYMNTPFRIHFITKGEFLCMIGLHKNRTRKFAGRDQNICERCGARD